MRAKALPLKKTKVHLSDPIGVDELYIAEQAILKYVQSTTFPLIGTQWKSSPVAKLKPFRDPTKVLRVGGRLDKALIPFKERHPAILPRNHHLTHLIVYHHHLHLGHAGTERVLTEGCQRFWIIKGWAKINHILRTCITC